MEVNCENFTLNIVEKICIVQKKQNIVADMTREEIENLVKTKLQNVPSIGSKYKFDLGDDGIIFIDGTQTPAVVNDQDEDADTTFVCSLDLAKGIVDGTQDPTMAYMTGKLKIQGSMGHALKLASFLED